MEYCTYILFCDQKTYYVGITNNLKKRLEEHRNKQPFFTKKFSDISLVYSEKYANKQLAEKREKQLKGLSQAKKKALIQGNIGKLKELSKVGFQKMKLIVCVCRGNIVRSPVAEKIIADELKARGLSDEYASMSRGIQGTSVDPEPVKFPNITYYEEIYEDSKPILKKFGINLFSRVSTPIDKETAERASIILAMDNKTKLALQTLFPDQDKKIHIFSELINENGDITDPEGARGKEKQEKIITEIMEVILQGFPKLLMMVQMN